MNVEGIVRKIVKETLRNSPAILTGLSIAGGVTTVALAISATAKAMILLEEERVEDQEFTKKEVIKIVWKCYVPMAVMGLTTAACTISANSISTRRTAALASAYSLTEAALKQYQAKVIETLDEKKEANIKESIVQDKLDANPVSGTTIVMTGKGQTLCFDSLSGRYFKSDIEAIRKIQNDFNKSLLSDMYCSLNDLYIELGLETTEMGRDMGWQIEHGMLDITFTAKIANNGEPCIVLEYRVVPIKL